jgi:hypothetical protein
VLRARQTIRTAGSLTSSGATPTYAAHVVAAAIVEALSGNTEVTLVQKRMLTLLKAQHDSNPAWGPLFVRSPGNLARHVAYVPAVRNPEAAVAAPTTPRRGRSAAGRPSRRPS